MYLDLVIGLNFLVDFLLLTVSNQISGFPGGGKRAAGAALLGGIYGGVCLLQEFRFLGNGFWRTVSLILMGMAAYGVSASAVRRTLVFLLLSMALGGMASALGEGSFFHLMLASLGLWLICRLGIQGNLGNTKYIPVELQYGEQSASLLALRDTGNTLKDPVSGQQVLVVGADVAETLTGLSQQQLSRPLETISEGKIPGLRLIPYHAVGQKCGMLLAMRLPQTRIGNRKGSSIVAFAPDVLCCEGTYQGLTGGAV